MKKICCVWLALLMALSGLALQALGAAEPLALVFSDVQAAEGSTITVTLSAKNNPGIKGIGAVLDYDHTVLRLTGATGNIEVGTWMIDTITQDDIVMWYSTDAFTVDGPIITLTFQVLEGTAGSTAVGLTFGDWDSVSDVTGSDITDFSVQAGTVTIADSTTVLKGDIDGNGVVNLKDVTRLFQYVNKQIDQL
jgi:phage baseplate assembly protein gpV